MKIERIADGWIETEKSMTYHGWPTLCKLPNGDLLAVASGGRESHVCPFGRIYCYRSTDGGLTWSEPQILSSGPLDDRDCGVTVAADGSILINYFTSTAFTTLAKYFAYRDDPVLWPEKQQEMLRECHHLIDFSDGWMEKMREINLDVLSREHGFWMMRSADNGRTWSEKYAVPVNNVHGPTLLQDGSLLWVGREKSGDFVQSATFGDAAKAYISRDNGLTWQVRSQLPQPGWDQRSFHELHSVQTADGVVITQIRCTYNTGCMGETYTLQTESYDGGHTWGPYRKICDGYPCHLTNLADGRVLTTYGWRQKPFGIRCRFGLELPLRFWQEEIVLTDDGDSLDLGYPSTVQLADGSLVTLWYQFRNAVGMASLRWLKWRA